MGSTSADSAKALILAGMVALNMSVCRCPCARGLLSHAACGVWFVAVARSVWRAVCCMQRVMLPGGCGRQGVVHAGAGSGTCCSPLHTGTTQATGKLAAPTACLGTGAAPYLEVGQHVTHLLLKPAVHHAIRLVQADVPAAH